MIEFSKTGYLAGTDESNEEELNVCDKKSTVSFVHVEAMAVLEFNYDLIKVILVIIGGNVQHC
jgi:hypothetical protein